MNAIVWICHSPYTFLPSAEGAPFLILINERTELVFFSFLGSFSFHFNFAKVEHSSITKSVSGSCGCWQLSNLISIRKWGTLSVMGASLGIGIGIVMVGARLTNARYVNLLHPGVNDALPVGCLRHQIVFAVWITQIIIVVVGRQLVWGSIKHQAILFRHILHKSKHISLFTWLNYFRFQLHFPIPYHHSVALPAVADQWARLLQVASLALNLLAEFGNYWTSNSLFKQN